MSTGAPTQRTYFQPFFNRIYNLHNTKKYTAADIKFTDALVRHVPIMQALVVRNKYAGEYAAQAATAQSGCVTS